MCMFSNSNKMVLEAWNCNSVYDHLHFICNKRVAWRKRSDNARNNARCMQLTEVSKTMHGLDGHQDVDRTPVEESVRMTEDRDKLRKYVHDVANPRIEDG